MEHRDRLLFISQELVPYGGGAAVACWMLQAVAEAGYEIVLLCWEKPDFEAVDKRFATSLLKHHFETRLPSRFERWMIDRIPDNSSMQRANYLLRLAKRMRNGFDAVVSCCSLESDVGEPAIEYIHYPYLASRSQVLAGDCDAPWRQKIAEIRAGQLRPWMIISGYSFDRMRANLHLTNSYWTRDEITRDCAMESEVVYPPAPGDYSPVDWDEREIGFITIGMFEPGKRFDWIIDTLEQVRRVEPRIQLHICGSRAWPDYLALLEDMARKHGSWVKIHIGLSNRELIDLACKQKYGIHSKIDEHFGIAPAQIARAGCIPFVHNSGGQVEIVDNDPRLCYSTREDAVTKILAVLGNPAMQEELRQSVHRRSDQFSVETFVSSIQTQVASFIEQRKDQS